MREPTIVKHQPLSLGNDSLVVKVGEKESICVYCKEKGCKENCKRYKEEVKKIKGWEKIFLPFSRWWGVGIIKKIMLHLKY